MLHGFFFSHILYASFCFPFIGSTVSVYRLFRLFFLSLSFYRVLSSCFPVFLFSCFIFPSFIFTLHSFIISISFDSFFPFPSFSQANWMNYFYISLQNLIYFFPNLKTKKKYKYVYTSFSTPAWFFLSCFNSTLLDRCVCTHRMI